MAKHAAGERKKKGGGVEGLEAAQRRVQEVQEAPEVNRPDLPKTMDLALLVQSHFCGSTVHSARSTSNTADGSCKLEIVGYGNKQAAALFFLHSQILTIVFLLVTCPS